MINAWIFYWNPTTHTHVFEERAGEDYKSIIPSNWGLADDCKVLLVLQNASFLQGWVRGNPLRKW